MKNCHSIAGQDRILWLENSRLNCWLMMLQLQDQVDCMTHEIEQIREGA